MFLLGSMSGVLAEWIGENQEEPGGNRVIKEESGGTKKSQAEARGRQPSPSISLPCGDTLEVKCFSGNLLTSMSP